jgi:AsmA protein
VTRHRRNLLLGSLLALAGLSALLLAAPLLLDTERYRSLLAARASHLLSREVRAQSLRVRLLPRPGAIVRGLVIADRAPWSGSFIETERLDVTLKLLPLLRGELQIRNIRIERPRIRLALGQDGWNLEDLIRPVTRPALAEPRRPEGTPSVRGQPALPVLLAGALTIRDGTLLFESATQNHARLEIRDLNLDVPAPLPLNPFRIHASGRLPGEVSGSFDLTGSLRSQEGDRLPIEAQMRVRGLEASQLASYLGLSGPAAAAFSGTVDLEGKAVGEWPRIDLQADIDLQRLDVTFGKETSKAPGEKAWLRAKGRWDGEALDLPEASLRWRNQTVTGHLHLANLHAPRIRFELNLPQLDVESLLAIATASGSATGHSSTPRRRGERGIVTSRSSDGTPYTERFAGLRVEGRLQSGAVHWGGLVLTPAEGELRYTGGLLTIRRLKGGFYGGRLSGDAVLDWRGRLPHTSMTARLEGVQTEPLLRAFQGDRWKLSGVMTLDSRLELSGQPGPGALTRASGQSELIVTGGRLTGYPPLDKVAQTFHPLLKGAGISSTLNEFDRLSAHWTLDGGILRTRDLSLQREGAKLFASGSMNLHDQSLDFDVTARVAKATLEAKVTGTPSNPVVTPQLGRIEQRIKTEVGKIMKGERGEALGNVLRQLLPR